MFRTGITFALRFLNLILQYIDLNVLCRLHNSTQQAYSTAVWAEVRSLLQKDRRDSEALFLWCTSLLHLVLIIQIKQLFFSPIIKVETNDYVLLFLFSECFLCIWSRMNHKTFFSNFTGILWLYTSILKKKRQLSWKFFSDAVQ